MHWFPFLPEETQPDPQGRHLVTTGTFNGDDKMILFIHKTGKETNLHQCDAFYFEDHSSIVTPNESSPSPDTVWIEHGWFSDPDLFATICTNQAAPNQPTPNQSAEQIFTNWRTAVLTTLQTHHANLWVPLSPSG